MLHRAWVEGVTLDMSRVNSYVPVLLALAQGVFPIIVLSFVYHEPRYIVLVVAASVLCVSFYTAFREEVFLFDTSRVALETLVCNTVFIFLECNPPATCGLVATVVLCWATVAMLYKIVVSPCDRTYGSWAFAGGCMFALALIALHEVRVHFHFDPALALLKAGVYVAVASLDAYTTCVFTTRRDGVVLRCGLCFFLHGPLLFCNTVPMALLLSAILLCTQGALIFRFRRQAFAEHWKKNDEAGQSSAISSLIGVHSLPPAIQHHSPAVLFTKTGRGTAQTQALLNGKTAQPKPPVSAPEGGASPRTENGEVDEDFRLALEQASALG